MLREKGRLEVEARGAKFRHVYHVRKNCGFSITASKIMLNMRTGSQYPVRGFPFRVVPLVIELLIVLVEVVTV